MSDSKNLNWQTVCDAEDLPADMGICAKLNGKQVAIFSLEKNDSFKLFAVGNHDPFSESNVLSRGLVGDLKGQYVVASPIYKQHFNLETGRCLEDESVVIPTYEVRNNDGVIEVAA